MDDSERGTVPKETAFDLLTAEQRRAVVELLSETNREYAIDDLACQVAARVTDVSPDSVGAETQERIQIALLHHHLPRLADEGIAKLDVDAQTVTPGDHIDDLDSLL